jgi:hypothetical protein
VCIVAKVSVFNKPEEMDYLNKLAEGMDVSVVKESDIGYYVVMRRL